VRGDLAATDIPVIEFMLSVTAEYARDVRPGIWRRYLALWLDALQPARESYTPLPVPELAVEEFATVMRTSPLGRPRTPISNTRSSPSRPPRSPPPSTEIVDNLLSLLIANLDKLFTEVTSFPFNNHRGELPAKISSQSFILCAVVMLKAPHEPGWVVDGPTTPNDGKICDPLRHQKPSFL
jgi:hypothetical protein